MADLEQLRVAIVAASLDSAGAEKQSFYIARALAEAGISVRVYYIIPGGNYIPVLHRLKVETICFGHLPSPFLRLAYLLSSLRAFRPHVIQSIHAYTNFYSAAAGKLLRTVGIGGLRSDLAAFIADHGRFSRYLLTGPDAIAVNSRKALKEITGSGLLDSSRVYLLPNAIDLDDFPEPVAHPDGSADCSCICVGRLFPAKRVDVFVRALALARLAEQSVRGLVVGFGPEDQKLEQLAAELGLLPGAIEFLGRRNDVMKVLERASIFVFCSESEGTPNVILEAMAAGLPIVTTSAGDAAEMVQAAGAGYVVPFGDAEATAAAMLNLARSPELRRKFGRAGRNYVAARRSTSELGGRLMKLYADVARTSTRRFRHGLLDRVLRSQHF